MAETDTSEKAFQNDIIAHLVSAGYTKRGTLNFNKSTCLDLELILKGKKQMQEFAQKLQNDMKQASDSLNYERAKEIRDTLHRLGSLQTKQKMEYVENDNETFTNKKDIQFTHNLFDDYNKEYYESSVVTDPYCNIDFDRKENYDNYFIVNNDKDDDVDDKPKKVE